MNKKTDQDIINFLGLTVTPDLATQIVQNVRSVVESRFIQAITELLDEQQLDEVARRQEADEPLATTREWLFHEVREAQEMYENLLADYLDELKAQTDNLTKPA